MRLIATLILAVVWATLVYGAHHAIGYDNATGYPAVSESLLWAGIAVLPLILGVFVISRRAGLGKYLRWLCAAALGVEALFLLWPSWLKILGIVPLIGVLLLMAPEMFGGKAAAPAQPFIPDKLKQKQRNHWFKSFAVAGLAALLVWGTWYRNPLPGDAQMIEHFNAHRVEFEQLVQGYRNYRRSDIFYERSSDEVEALTNRLGVHRVVEVQGASGYWYPNPYSERTARLQGEYFGHTVALSKRTPKEDVEYWQTNMPELLDGFAPVNNVWDVIRITAVIHVFVGSAGQSDTKFILRYGGIHKGFYHFPQTPQVKEGRILVPEHDLKDKPTIRVGQRVLDSLDDYPVDWRRGECVLKHMDDHWFIAMCRNG